MGGFEFQGPNYTIENVYIPITDKHVVRCRCSGYEGTISEEVEKLLIEKADKILVVSELPLDLQEKIKDYHLGEIMEYTVRENTAEECEQYARYQEAIKKSQEPVYMTGHPSTWGPPFNKGV